MKGRFRLLSALGIAVVLSIFLMYSALAGGDVQRPVVELENWGSQKLIASKQTVELVGIARKPITKGDTGTLTFVVSDEARHAKVTVKYSGSVPDAFRAGRTVIVSGILRDGAFHAKPDSLVTKCPSKFVGEGKSKPA